MMKNLLLTLLFLGVMIPVNAQRFGYVDTDFVLDNLPEYVQAKNTLKTKTEQWNQEIQNRQETLEKRQADFLNEKVLLTEEQIKKEEEEINKEISEIKKLQEKRYGQNGDLIKLRKSLVKPIQDQIYLAVDQIAKKKNYSFIFDKGSDLIMIYTDPKFDISRDVVLELNPNAIIKETQAPEPKPKGKPAPKGKSSSSPKGKSSAGSRSGSPAKTGDSRSAGGNQIKK